ncbi:OLC1v1029247C2 [Oldenlandia corymbosa var. corymbosa]|uniref:OLC1v1029247C2 n=1 Tax=Oldenlandia corymbosa var. corymbosa TaxID=529605 RepID=A0AAV1CGE5_OLDCO|nr:OLC1v1029247C2 [Oldenlandia corymbosa var. corymbosa]
MQFLREKKFKQAIAQVKVEDGQEITHEIVIVTLRRVVHFFSALQASDGHWPPENAGPLSFLPPLVMCLYITEHLNTVISAEHKIEILRYIYCHQDPMAVRIIHVPELGNGFLTMVVSPAIPSWEKTWLSIIGLYDWSGTNPMPPEFWILLSFLPVHPGGPILPSSLDTRFLVG